MKFEQAYYTWSKKLLSAHQQGLGIVASSMKAPEFLDCCERLAMDIKTGPDGETARLLYYDFASGRYAAISCAACEDGGDGRNNRLCQVLIPSERIKKYEDYLLDYPFDTRMPKTDTLEAWEPDETIEKPQYDLPGILKKYFLGQRSLACCIRKFYEYLADTEGMLAVTFPKGYMQKKGDKAIWRIAAEWMYLFYQMYPACADQGRLSYGIHSERNGSKVRIHFTEDGHGAAKDIPFFGKKAEAESSSGMYEALAHKMIDGGYREYLEELLGMLPQGEQDVRHLPFAYALQRLREGNTVTEQELGLDLLVLADRARGEGFYRELLYSYLRMARGITTEQWVFLWTSHMLPELRQGCNSALFADVTAKMLSEIKENSPGFYAKAEEEIWQSNKSIARRIGMEKGRNSLLREIRIFEAKSLGMPEKKRMARYEILLRRSRKEGEEEGARLLEALASRDILLLMAGFKTIGDREGFWRHIGEFSQEELVQIELAFARHPKLREALDLKDAPAYKAYSQMQEIKKEKKYDTEIAVQFNWIETADVEDFV